jgi:hypothetical protein
VERSDQGLVHLQHGLAAGEHDEGRRAAIAPPSGTAGLGERVRVSKLAAAVAVGADKVCVAESAGRGLAVGLAAGPQIAAGEAAEHGRPPSLRAFAL